MKRYRLDPKKPRQLRPADWVADQSGGIVERQSGTESGECVWQRVPWIRRVVRRAQRDLRISRSRGRVLENRGEARWPLAGLTTLKQHASARVVHFRGAPPNAGHSLIASLRRKGIGDTWPEDREPIINVNIQ